MRIVDPRVVTLVRDKTVRRVLPVRGGTGVGPFLFLDHMGPWNESPDTDNDIGPHPHIGLETVTYLFTGRLLHRDSIGSLQEIKPGDVNWMTAGKGIAHSERTPDDLKKVAHEIHGLQAWVALPLESEEVDPSFNHYPKETLPEFEKDGVKFKLIAGSAFGYTSPVRTYSKLFYLEARLSNNSELAFSAENQETGFYLIEGKITVNGEEFSGPRMFIFDDGNANFSATEDSFGMLLGGERLGRRFMWWNFVSSSKERIEVAKVSWKNQTFAKIPGETEFIPLPE